jgi:hypothetical protein
MMFRQSSTLCHQILLPEGARLISRSIMYQRATYGLSRWQDESGGEVLLIMFDALAGSAFIQTLEVAALMLQFTLPPLRWVWRSLYPSAPPC